MKAKMCMSLMVLGITVASAQGGIWKYYPTHPLLAATLTDKCNTTNDWSNTAGYYTGTYRQWGFQYNAWDGPGSVFYETAPGYKFTTFECLVFNMDTKGTFETKGLWSNPVVDVYNVTGELNWPTPLNGKRNMLSAGTKTYLGKSADLKAANRIDNACSSNGVDADVWLYTWDLSAYNTLTQDVRRVMIRQITNASQDFTGGDAVFATPSNTRLDNLKLTVVPEPATMVLLSLGSLAMLRRRRS